MDLGGYLDSLTVLTTRRGGEVRPIRIKTITHIKTTKKRSQGVGGRVVMGGASSTWGAA